MANKHEIQKDFYTKMSEWKQGLEVKKENTEQSKREYIENENKNHRLVLNNAHINGIKCAEPAKDTMEKMKSPEYEALVEEANRRIDAGRKREAKAWRDAKNYIGGERDF